MPAISCRDLDEPCDWFFRSPSVSELIAIGAEHDIEAHKENLEKMFDAFIDGSYKMSDDLKKADSRIRND